MTQDDQPAAGEPRPAADPTAVGTAEPRATYPSGLLDTLDALATEAVDPTLADIDTRPTDDLVTLMIDRDRVLPEALAACAEPIAAAIDQISARLAAGGRLFYLGAGTAGRLGVLDASEIPPTFGTEPDLVRALIAGGPTATATAVEDAEDDTGAAPAELAAAGLSDADAVIGIAASGRTPYVLAGIEHARRRGALTVGLTNNANSPIGRAADIAIEVVVGPEFITGSTRLRAGTAQKMVLNMISTIVMVRLGKTYGNLMVDLSATNAKLRARSERTIISATGADAETAADALRRADGSVKLAIVLVETGLDPIAARRLLGAHAGRLRAALESQRR
jgi:N-acetylmuramic acid 6-phosphate etherase